MNFMNFILWTLNLNYTKETSSTKIIFFLILGRLCKMLRNYEYGNKRGLCWKNSIEGSHDTAQTKREDDPGNSNSSFSEP